MNGTPVQAEQPRPGPAPAGQQCHFFPALTVQGLSLTVPHYAVMHSAECALNKVSFSS